MIELLFACAIVCRGDVCVMEPDLAPVVVAAPVAVAAPQRSIVVKRTYATQFGAKHPVLSAPVRIVGKAAKCTKRTIVVGTAKVVGKAAKVVLPPYPRVRARLCN
jgi:hypothetical protein